MSNKIQKIPGNSERVSPGEIIKSYYTHSESVYSKAELILQNQLRVFSHQDHLLFNFLKTGTFPDKLTAIKELIEVF